VERERELDLAVRLAWRWLHRLRNESGTRRPPDPREAEQVERLALGLDALQARVRRHEITTEEALDRVDDFAGDVAQLRRRLRLNRAGPYPLAAGC
jgi:hypothetical protein